MALLTQTTPPEQTAQMTRDPAAARLPTPESEQPEGEQAQGLTFTTEQLVDSFKQNMDGEQAKDMGLIIDEGKQLMFGPESHSKIMGMLEGSQNIGQDLGEGAFSAMNLVLKSMAEEKPNEEIKGDAVLPAGLALISLALEFMNESGMASVNDDTFEEASHIFSTKMMDTYDPEFKGRREQYAAPQQTTDSAQQGAQMQQPVTGEM